MTRAARHPPTPLKNANFGGPKRSDKVPGGNFKRA
jgi:hypothetical protein